MVNIYTDPTITRVILFFTKPNNGTFVREIPKISPYINTFVACLMSHLMTSPQIGTFEDKFPFPKVEKVRWLVSWRIITFLGHTFLSNPRQLLPFQKTFGSFFQPGWLFRKKNNPRRIHLKKNIFTTNAAGPEKNHAAGNTDLAWMSRDGS